LVQDCHPFAQIICQVADGGQLDVARFPGGVEMGNLGDGTASQDAEAELARLFFHRVPTGDVTGGVFFTGGGEANTKSRTVVKAGQRSMGIR
jgi:hypothetical protein